VRLLGLMAVLLPTLPACSYAAVIFSNVTNPTPQRSAKIIGGGVSGFDSMQESAQSFTTPALAAGQQFRLDATCSDGTTRSTKTHR